MLALSVNDTLTNAALTGNARQITITNTGPNTATGVSVLATGLPAGTDITTIPTTCTGTLAPGATCTVSITPGQNATSSCTTGIAPTPGKIIVSATNVGTPASSDVVVLGYGCQYQGGFLYSVDDTTNNGVTGACLVPPCTNSIGGKVASLTDQADPNIGVGPQATSTIWSSNGSGNLPANVSYDIVPLIADVSTANDSYANAQLIFDTTYVNTLAFPFPILGAFAPCNGASDGACNTNNILALYDTYNTGYGIGGSPYTLSAGPTNRGYYAAGVCTATINTYSDWYLPAICEMNSVWGSVICPPGEQSMVVSLAFLIADHNAVTPSTECNPPVGTHCLSGDYWSSTEDLNDPDDLVWFAYYTTGASAQLGFDKSTQLGARCSRALTF